MSINVQKKVNGLRFAVNEMVMCPAHGLGKITSVEEYDVADQTLEVCKIFFEKDKMNLMIPLTKMVDMRVRRLVSKDTIAKVFGILSRPCKIVRGMWNKRAKEYDSKVYSGSILLTAEVVRDLWNGVNDMNRSYSERIIFENALDRIVSEISVVMKISKEEGEKMITGYLNKSYSGKSSNISNENDVFTIHEDEVSERIAV